jgi:hypothetical protein
MCVGLLVGLLATTSSSAAPGDHIQVGNKGELVPSVDLGMEYRTNVYRTEVAPTGGANMRLAPGIDLMSSTDQNDFSLGGQWELRKFLFVGADEETGLTQQERVANLDRYNDFRFDARADTLKDQVVGFRLSDRIALKNNSVDAEYADAPFSTQFRNQLDGGLRVSPGPALSLVLGGGWAYDDFLLPAGEGEDRQFNTRQTYGPSLKAKWDFLPRTGLLFDFEYMMHRWAETAVVTGADGAESEFGDAIAVPNSDHIKTELGIQGRFTERLSLVVVAGYGLANYDADGSGAVADLGDIAASVEGADGILASVNGQYLMGQSTFWSFGYSRDFMDSFFTNYSAYNFLHTSLRGKYGDVVPSARYSARFENYNGEVVRSDLLSKVELDLGYEIRSYASISGGVWWQQRASNQDNVEYDDFNIHLMGTFAY